MNRQQKFLERCNELRNMRPCFPVDNSCDGRTVNAEHPSEFTMGQSQRGSYKRYIFIGHFGHAALLTAPVVHVTSLDHIPAIVLLRSDVQMIRICALWIVTLMKNTFAFWYGSKMYNPRSPMGKDSSSRHKADGARHAYSSIAVLTEWSHPLPARAKCHIMDRWGSVFVHFRPEPLKEVLRKTLRHQIFRSNFALHNFSYVDFVPRSRPRQWRGDNSFI